MTRHTLKVVSSQENFNILNSEPKINFETKSENHHVVELEFETQLDRAEMKVRLVKSSHPYPY